jgi:hypothetical protein
MRKNADMKAYPSKDLSMADEMGLTKREYFAGLAMQGLISNPDVIKPSLSRSEDLKEFGEVCLKYADGLLNAIGD